jgi:hypothetical protein
MGFCTGEGGSMKRVEVNDDDKFDSIEREKR